MSRFLFLLCGLGWGIFFLSHSAWARPEYATQTKMNCVACHAMPWGGGPRIVFGKVFGSHGHDPAKTSTQDLFYGDLRFIDYYATERTSERSNGLALMEAAVSADVPVIQSPDGSEMRVVATYNMSPLAGSQVREAYIRWQLAAESGHTPTQFVFGRFYVPFGLLTDEHRTYTRIQTGTTLNNYDVGGAVSSNWTEALHTDLALVNDFQTGGNFSSKDISWGGVINLRWNPKELPFLLGASGLYQHRLNRPEPFAQSVYAVLSLDRLSHDKIRGSLSYETVLAKNLNNPDNNPGQINPSLAQFFVPSTDTAYLNSIAQSRSLGMYGLAKYVISSSWLIFYKLDYLDLDLSSPQDDTYWRHGAGFETYLNSNLILNARFERVQVGRASVSSSDVLATQNDIFAMLRLWL